MEDDRLTNVLNKAISLAKQAHNKQDDVNGQRELISYVIGSLETAVELIRPDSVKAIDPKKPFIKSFLP